MPRSGRIRKRVLPKDPIYQSRLVTRLINRVMERGKKTVAQKLVYQAFEQMKKEAKKDPLDVFQAALENVKPAMEVRSRRVGGASYQVPIPVRGEKKESLAIRWLVQAAKARVGKEYRSFDKKLAAEILAASKKEGGAVRRKEEIHKVADANKAFAHFRW